MDVAIPTKGASTPLRARYSVTVLDKAVGFGLRLYNFDTNQMKDFIAGRLGVAAGAAGSWNVCKDVEPYYADQICAEQKVEYKDKKGRITLRWEPISSHAQNHLLDTETNSALAAEILGVRYLMEPDTEEMSEPEENDWLGDAGKNWF